MLNYHALQDLKKNISNQYINKTSDFAKDKKKGWKLYKNISKRWYINKDIQWEKLCLDEKNVKNKVYTWLSDSKNNKLISWIPWIKSDPIIRKLKKIPKKVRDNIKEVSVDMSNGMEKIARKVFRKAIIVTDRFHVRKLVNDMVWWLKTRLKIKLSREIAKQKKKNKKHRIKRYENGETRIEMLTRAHYQIRKNRKNWNVNQRKRWKIIEKLQYFKWVVAIYEMSMELYEIYEQKISKYEATILMKEWIKKARRYRRIPELLHLADSIERRLDTITNYFVSRHSNWFWEWLNSRIWHIVRDNRWFTNEDYMVFRFIKALW